MKVKVLNVNPVGDIIEEEDFEFSFVKPVKVEWKNGIRHEPRKRDRFILEIGDYVYHINPENGELCEIEHLRKNKLMDN